MALGCIGAAVGAVIILIPFNEGSLVKAKPEFLLWTFLSCSLLAIVFILIAPLWGSILLVKQYFKGNLLEIIASVFLLIVLFSSTSVVSPNYVSPAQSLKDFGIGIKTTLLAAIPEILVGLPAILGIILIQCAVKDRRAEMRIDANQRNLSDHIKWISKHKSLLQGLLWMVGSVLGLGILVSGALTKLSAAMGTEIPPILVLIYGAFFSLILAIIYIPTYSSLVVFGYDVRDEMFPLPSHDSDSWMEIISKRKALEQELQLQVGAGQNIRSSIAIIAPLIGGIISAVLDIG